MTSRIPRVLARAGALLGLIPAAAFAQQTIITGRVLNEANAPLRAATVGITALGVGAQTNDEGVYRIVVNGHRDQTVTLLARRLGYEPKTVALRLSSDSVTQDFQMEPAPIQLTGVVTTALGIQKEKSQLGTAQQELSSQELNQTFSPNLVNQLEGKVSGVNIIGNGTQGGSTSITIRGYTSISGNNQPLFIVDGIPVSNSDRGSSSGGGGMLGSHDFGNAIQDINPDDIASISVLKGPNAAALYGSRAANGAIIIVTKHGSQTNSNMDVTSSVTWDRPSILPDFQNEYGQGASGQFKWKNGLGALDGNDQSYGPRFSDTLLIMQFTSALHDSMPLPWVAHPDNVSSFFNTGRTANFTVGISGGTDRANARLSVNGENVDGIIPNNFLRRLGGMASGSLQATDRLTLNGSVDYVRNDGLNRPGQGYVGGIMEGLYVWFGRQVDMQALKDNWQKSGGINNGPDNREFNWNYSYHNNPYFMQYANPESDQRDRVIANGSATYKFTDWLNATLRSGTDTYRYGINTDYAAGNIELNNGSNTVNPAYNGAFTTLNDASTENNTDLLVTANKDVTSKLNLNATVGGNRRYNTFNENIVAVNGITVPGIYNVANAGIPPTNTQFEQNQAVNSVFGDASFTWNGWWTVEGTARNDWSSTLPQANNSYFYPSVNTSIVLSDAIPSIKNSVISYLKLRGGTARVGNDAPPYSLYTTFSGNANQFGGLPLYSLGNTLQNQFLKPEQTTSNEVGVELGLFNNRVSLDASVYKKSTKDEITTVTIPSSSGFSSQLLNAGQIDNKGFEALLNFEPIRTGAWDWNSTINFSHNRGTVVSLAPGLESIRLGNFRYTEVDAIPGQPYGTIRGFGIKRDANGVPLLDNIGEWESTDTLITLGNIQPDWIAGWVNTVHYKGFTLGATLDIRHGGKLFSGTNFFGTATGTLASTLKGREVDWNKPGFVINGLICDSDGANCVQNTNTITTEQYFQSLAYNEIGEPYVYDDSYLKLREIRLGYDLPQRLANRLSANAVNIAFVGRNVFTHSNVPNVDPEVTYGTGNSNGLEYAELPVPRSFGFNVRITP